MKCLDFASRKALIPLPNVIQDIVNAFLSDDLIPLRVLHIPSGHKVLMIDKENVYTREGESLYKNNELIFQNREPHFGTWNLYPVYGDWILLNDILYHITNKHVIHYLMLANSARVFDNYVYFISDNDRYDVYRLSFDDLDGVPEKYESKVSKLTVIGNCLVFTKYFNKKFHDSDIGYVSEHIYRWQNKVYEVTPHAITCDNQTVCLLSGNDILKVFAIDQHLFLDTTIGSGVFDCNTHKFQNMPFLSYHSGRLWCKKGCELFLYH